MNWGTLSFRPLSLDNVSMRMISSVVEQARLDLLLPDERRIAAQMPGRVI
jgi:hypothetical protein